MVITEFGGTRLAFIILELAMFIWGYLMGTMALAE